MKILHYHSAQIIEHFMTARPIYRIGHKHYGIDDCEPQKEAVREGKIEFHALTKGHYSRHPDARERITRA